MEIISYEMKKFIVPKNWKLKKFDLKLINSLERNYPYQRIMTLIYKYYISFFDNEIDDDVNILNYIDYFQLLDRYYRYGITFEDSDLYPKEFFGSEYPVKNVYNPKEFYTKGIPFNNNLYVFEEFSENYAFCYIIENRYNIKQLLFNDVKTINLDDVDNGSITLSEIEKWKRKVVNQQTNRIKKLLLLHPNVYHSLITFFVFSKIEGRLFNNIYNDFSSFWDKIHRFNDRKLNKYKDK